MLVSSLWLPPQALAAAQSLVDIYQEAKANDPVLASAGSAGTSISRSMRSRKGPDSLPR